MRSVELATLGRRIAETEWDLLRLIAGIPESETEPPPSSQQDRAPLEDRPTLQDRPSAAELLEAVREFLERDVATATEGRTAFHARVAVNALAIVERELVLGPSVDAPVITRLARLLDRSGTPTELVVDLAARIRDGSLDDRRDEMGGQVGDEVVDTVRDLVRAKLAVANPRYR